MNLLVPASLAVFAGVFSVACSQKPAEPTGYRVYVTNENVRRHDGHRLRHYGSRRKRAPGHAPARNPRSPDGKLLYIALSGSPIGGPNVDESTLPPPDKSKDGIGVFDIAQNKVVKIIEGGSDPENFAVSKDGKWIYVSNEDDDGISFIDLTAGKLVPPTIKTGEEPEGVSLTPDGKLTYSTTKPTALFQ